MGMSTKTADKATRRTTMVPVTTMEKIPVLDDAERGELVASLRDAEEQIAAGDGHDYDSETFVAKLRALYGRRAQGV